ncbi:hypothetical protein OO258_27310 [Pseudomonas sp. DCB_BI]|uniref:hypothetical protein n=1 Tax=Pseudomonas sp. DCB_BI TaxID=2993594 RepID=UPI00224ABF79|nr:hypothetical protein [Pseudomonas sp. DCB_BI]MCX2891934.1 hypothetical protein [Pseudomonas sp. DCB_BI]
MGEPGARNWTAKQREDILANKTPRFNGEPIQGCHRYSALDHPQLASDPKDILRRALNTSKDGMVVTGGMTPLENRGGCRS